MTSRRPWAAADCRDARCYRLTPKGRACVAVVQAEGQTVGSLSRYLHDVLLMCGTGVWFDQLRQFMPPRSLEESLKSLIALDLVEEVPPPETPRREAFTQVRESRRFTAWGQMALG